MRVQDLFIHEVASCHLETTLRQAAQLMQERACGALPVVDHGNRVLGMITDRDIAVRGVAQGKTANAKVRDVMTPEIKYCFDDQELDEIAANMADIQVRRLPVLDRDKRLVGIVSLADIAVSDDTSCAVEALSGISRANGGPAVFPVL